MGINIRRKYGHTDSQDVLLERFNSSGHQGDHPFILQFANDLIFLNVKKDAQHWWSPEVSLRLEQDGTGTKVYETIGPNPAMFTLAMFFVILGAAIFIAALMWALSQMSVGDSPVLAWIITCLSGLMIALTFGWLALGRMKAAEQVSSLRRYILAVIQS